MDLPHLGDLLLNLSMIDVSEDKRGPYNEEHGVQRRELEQGRPEAQTGRFVQKEQPACCYSSLEGGLFADRFYVFLHYVCVFVVVVVFPQDLGFAVSNCVLHLIFNN